MTFEELLELPAADISKLTAAQIEAVVRPYFPITRPRDLSPAGSAIDDGDMDPEIAARMVALRAKPTALQAILAKAKKL